MEDDLGFSYLSAKKRKRRFESRLDLKDQAIINWYALVDEKRPEVMEPIRFKEEIKTRLETSNVLSQEEINYLDKHLVPEPGRPRCEIGKNFTKDDWDAWFAYYCLLQHFGFYISPNIIAYLTKHSKITVSSQFKAVKRRIGQMKKDGELNW